jgi:hypothetical protein
VISRQAITAGKLAADDLEGYGEPAANIGGCFEQGGYTTEQVLGDWFPDPPG